MVAGIESGKSLPRGVPRAKVIDGPTAKDLPTFEGCTVPTHESPGTSTLTTKTTCR